MIWNLYINQKAVVRQGSDISEDCDIGRVVRQGCCLSPVLFSMYADAMMDEAMEGLDEGIKVGGRAIHDLRFADDQAMIGRTEKGLHNIMDRVNESAKEYNMKINVKKTKVMKVAREKGTVNLIIDNQKVDKVESYKYLGNTGTDRV